MNFNEQRQSILEKLEAEWDKNTYPLEMPNTKIEQQPTGPWCRASVLNADTNPASVTTKMTRTDGILVLQCFERDGMGTAATAKMGDALAAIFNHLTLTVASGIIVFRTVNTQTIGVQDGWHQVNAVVRFRADAFTA